MPKLNDDATVAFVRENNLEDRVAKATELAISTIERKLRGANGNTLIRNLLPEHWPTRLSVAQVRNENLYSLVAIATGITASEIRSALDGANGNAHVRTVLFSDEGGEGGGGGDVGAYVNQPSDGTRPKCPLCRVELPSSEVGRVNCWGCKCVIMIEFAGDGRSGQRTSTGDNSRDRDHTGNAAGKREDGWPSDTHANEDFVRQFASLSWPATLDQVKKARRDYSVMAHPDRQAGETATESLTRINDGCDRLELRLAGTENKGAHSSSYRPAAEPVNENETAHGRIYACFACVVGVSFGGLM